MGGWAKHWADKRGKVAKFEYKSFVTSLERADKKTGWVGIKLIVHLRISVTKWVWMASLNIVLNKYSMKFFLGMVASCYHCKNWRKLVITKFHFFWKGGQAEILMSFVLKLLLLIFAGTFYILFISLLASKLIYGIRFIKIIRICTAD